MSQEIILEIENLHKSFNKYKAVDGLSVKVQQGEIYGFLGPNGAGKSTTIRVILSLLKADSGKVYFFGKELTPKSRHLFSKVGALVEKPDFYLYLTAYKNLEYFSDLYGRSFGKTKLLETLELVGLKGRENDKVKTYSLGMKQRLGLAQALIHNPDLIILDEPTNGLDPQGMREVRNLLIDLATNQGKTIFLSSHILKEVESMASSLAIINKGKTIVQGKVNDLLKDAQTTIFIETNEISPNFKLDNTSFFQVKNITENKIEIEAVRKDIPQIIDVLRNKNIDIYSVNSINSLEEYFIKLTGEHSVS
jgi:ABC-2 type transport system ATP-binding protein